MQIKSINIQYTRMRIQLYELTRAGPITKTAVQRVEKAVELYMCADMYTYTFKKQ